jgi:Na+/proline symporter
VSTLLLTGGLAALMSTLDSQLLTMGSMIGLDFGGKRGGRVAVQRLIVVLIGAAAYLLALKPPQTILDFVNRTSFTGLAALGPAVIGGLFWKRANRYGALAGILAGEVVTVLSYFRVVRVPGVLPVVPALAVAAAAFLLVSVLTSGAGENAFLVALPAGRSGRRTVWVGLVFLGFFVLGNDYWGWGRTPVILAGLPLWVWYYILLAGAYWKLLGRSEAIDR